MVQTRNSQIEVGCSNPDPIAVQLAKISSRLDAIFATMRNDVEAIKARMCGTPSGYHDYEDISIKSEVPDVDYDGIKGLTAEDALMFHPCADTIDDGIDSGIDGGVDAIDGGTHEIVDEIDDRILPHTDGIDKNKRKDAAKDETEGLKTVGGTGYVCIFSKQLGLELRMDTLVIRAVDTSMGLRENLMNGGVSQTLQKVVWGLGREKFGEIPFVFEELVPFIIKVVFFIIVWDPGKEIDGGDNDLRTSRFSRPEVLIRTQFLTQIRI
jgi:hypothetical protein